MSGALRRMSASLEVSPKRRRIAILFADIAGYSRSMQHDEEGTYRRVLHALDLFRTLVGDYGGRVVDTAGDGVFAVFEEAAGALRFAIEIQREFRNDTVWSAAAERLAFRIGIHAGEVMVMGDRVAGHHVNVAARIEALARPGGICVSEPVRRELADDREILFRSLGRARLKNIAEPLELFAVETADLAPSPEDPPPEREESRLLVEGTSVAVLPIENASGYPEDDHLCDGITADLIGNLSRFRELFVIARHSVFLFKGRHLPPATIADRLGVRYLLTGSLRRAGPRLRLEVELTEAASGRILWRERYDGRLADLFTFQDDVTATLAAGLAVRISEAERRLLERQTVPELRAYGLVLRGQHLVFRYRRESVLHARRLFERAIAVDPDYGRAYAGMSRTYNLVWRYRWDADPEACLERAVELADEAIARDPLDARGFAELGFARLYRREYEASLAAYERALSLNPNDADILAEYGDALYSAGRAEPAVEVLERAIRLNPYHPDWYLWNLGGAYFTLDRLEEVIATLKKMRDQTEAHRLLAASYALLGRMEEARHHARALLEAHPDFSLETWRRTVPNRESPHLERYFEGLRLAGLE